MDWNRRTISAFMIIKAWRKNENTCSFDILTKGTMLTVEGYFKLEAWIDKDGIKRNRIMMTAVRYLTEEKNGSS